MLHVVWRVRIFCVLELNLSIAFVIQATSVSTLNWKQSWPIEVTDTYQNIWHTKVILEEGILNFLSVGSFFHIFDFILFRNSYVVFSVQYFGR